MTDANDSEKERLARLEVKAENIAENLEDLAEELDNQADEQTVDELDGDIGSVVEKVEELEKQHNHLWRIYRALKWIVGLGVSGLVASGLIFQVIM